MKSLQSRFVQAYRIPVSFSTLTAVLLLALAAPSFVEAQAVTPGALVGSWAKKGTTQPYITFKADSTFTVAGVGNGRWRLVGDTFTVDTFAMQNRQPTNAADLLRLVTIKDRELTLTELKGTKVSRVYERVDSVTAKPSEPAKKP